MTASNGPVEFELHGIPRRKERAHEVERRMQIRLSPSAEYRPPDLIFRYLADALGFFRREAQCRIAVSWHGSKFVPCRPDHPECSPQA